MYAVEYIEEDYLAFTITEIPSQRLEVMVIANIESLCLLPAIHPESIFEIGCVESITLEKSLYALLSKSRSIFPGNQTNTNGIFYLTAMTRRSSDKVNDHIHGSKALSCLWISHDYAITFLLDNTFNQPIRFHVARHGKF